MASCVFAVVARVGDKLFSHRSPWSTSAPNFQKHVVLCVLAMVPWHWSSCTRYMRHVARVGSGLSLCWSCCGTAQIRGRDVVWAIKDDYIGNTLLDASASRFFMEYRKGWVTAQSGPDPAAAAAGAVSTPVTGVCGSALGPKWEEDVADACADSTAAGSVTLLTDVTVVAVRDAGGDWMPCDAYNAAASKCADAACVAAAGGRAGDSEWPLYLRFSNGVEYGCDLVVRCPLLPLLCPQ